MRSVKLGKRTGSFLTLFRSEIPIRYADILKLISCWVLDFHIACHVSITINFGKLVKVLVRNLGHIQFVIPDCEQVIINLFENWVG